MLVGTQCGFVLQDSLGGVPVVDLGQQTPPGANHRLEHHGIPQALDGFDGRFGRVSHDVVGLGDAGLGQGNAGGQLIAADLSHLGGIDGGDAPGIQDAQRIQAAHVADTALQDGIVPEPLPGSLQVEPGQAIVDPLVIDVACFEGRKEPLLFDAQARKYDADLQWFMHRNTS